MFQLTIWHQVNATLRGDKFLQDETIAFEFNTLEVSAPGKIKRMKVVAAESGDITWMTREGTKDIRKQARALSNGIRQFLSPLWQIYILIRLGNMDF